MDKYAVSTKKFLYQFPIIVIIIVLTYGIVNLVQSNDLLPVYYSDMIGDNSDIIHGIVLGVIFLSALFFLKGMQQKYFSKKKGLVITPMTPTETPTVQETSSASASNVGLDAAFEQAVQKNIISGKQEAAVRTVAKLMNANTPAAEMVKAQMQKMGK